MKRIVYIGAFAFLGVLFATLLHGLIEIPVLTVITGDLDRYGDSFVWQNWEMLHGVLAGALWIKGAVIGGFLGRRYWNIIYIEKRRDTLRW